MGPMSEGEDCGDSVNLSGKKRFNGDNEGGDSKGKKVRILEIIDETFGVLDGFDGEKKGIIGNEAMGFGEDMNLNGKGVSCSGDEKNMDIDLNVATIDLEDDEFVPVGVDRRVEIIDIPSDESDVEEVREIAPEDVKGKGKQIEDGFAYERIENFDFGLGLMEGNVGGNSFLSDGRRYTRDEKGKSKDYDFWLSLATNPTLFELQRGTEDSFQPEVQPGSQDLIQFEVQPESHDLIQFEVQQGSHASVQFELEPGSQLNEDIDQLERLRLTIEQERRNAESLARQLDILRNARRFARVEDNGEASANQEKAPLEDDSLLGKSPGPFSTALKMVRERKSSRPEQLIDWKPSNNGRNAFRPPVSSLLDLSMKALAANAEAIVSLELVPDILKQGLADLICNLRKMNNHTFELLVKGSPTEIRIKDCSWLTEDQFLKTFGDFDAKSLTVLQVELCGQCTLDNVMSKTLAKFSKSLPNLGVISLKGACRLSNNGIKALVRSAPALQSINLSQCSLLTDVGINILADSLGSMLRELFIDDCQKIDAMLILPALKKFENLEVLSIAGIQTVSDQFVDGLITARGSKIKELDFANCLGLSNYSLKVIGDSCTGLLSLNISDLDKLTDLGLQFLADGCRCIQTLKLCRNKFSDDAIAAFLEASGESLKEFSLNNVTLVGPCTAFSLAKCSRKLLGLDLSWCRKITNEALGLIVDSCLSLKLVKLFGCTQITSVFLNGHSNPQVQIIGLQLTPILENANELEPSKVLLRYSPLEFLPDSM